MFKNFSIFAVIIMVAVTVTAQTVWADEGSIEQVPVGGKKIFINFSFTGNTYGLQEYYPGYFRIKAMETKKLQVCAWGGELDNINQATDYFRNSGRYKQNQAPSKGEYEVPTLYFKVHIECEVEQVTGAVAIPLPFQINGQQGSSLNLGGAKTANVFLSIERYDPVSGTALQGFLAKGKHTGLDQAAIYIPNVGAGGILYRQNFERSLVGKAARAATDAFVRQILSM